MTTAKKPAAPRRTSAEMRRRVLEALVVSLDQAKDLVVQLHLLDAIEADQRDEAKGGE